MKRCRTGLLAGLVGLFAWGVYAVSEAPVEDVGFPHQPVVFLPTDAEWGRSMYSEHAVSVRGLSDAHLALSLRGVKDTDHQVTRTVEFVLEGRSGRHRLWVWDAESQVYRDTVAVPCDETVNLSLLMKPAEMKALKRVLVPDEPHAFRLLVNSKVGADFAELGDVQVINFDRLNEKKEAGMSSERNEEVE